MIKKTLVALMAVADPGLQSGALAFMWIDPNLAASEASQFTPWAARRSGNASYSGVSFITDTDAVALNFSNIVLYTGGDMPFTKAAASPNAAFANGTSTPAITGTVAPAATSASARRWATTWSDSSHDDAIANGDFSMLGCHHGS